MNDTFYVASPEGKLQLFINCIHLSKVKVFSGTHPLVEVFYRRTVQSKWVRLGTTEVISDCLNPDFVTYFLLDYDFREHSHLFLKVWSCSDSAGRIDQSTLIGQAECSVHEIVGKVGGQVFKPLFVPNKNMNQRGTIVLRTEEVEMSRETVHLELRACNIQGTSNWFRKFKPFFCLSRELNDLSYLKVYRSEHIKGRSGAWRPVNLSLQELTNSDYERPLKLEVFDRHRNGAHLFISEAVFTLDALLHGNVQELPLINSKSKGPYGSIRVEQIEVTREVTFLDYIAGGCQINLIGAVDFSIFNGDPNFLNSLHFCDSTEFNEYELALASVCEILLNYDSDQLVPMYGFGADIDGMTNHCFHLNGEPRPDVFGLSGILQSYRKALRTVAPGSHSHLSQVLRAAVTQAESIHVHQHHQQYFILLILTSGQINDLQESIDWVVRGSNAPLSVVIVGIGDGDFASMELLDADDIRLVDSRGIRMKRDIVQFVPFREVGSNPVALSREVLDEIPRELVKYFRRCGITPNPPLPYQPQSYFEPTAPLDN